MFEPDIGCLVHNVAKPVPCTMHACYENATDLPPDSLQDEAELAIARLNERTFRASGDLLALPLALKRWASSDAA